MKPTDVRLQSGPDGEHIIRLDGYIGDEIEGLISSAFAEQLDQVPAGERVTVEINSYGGTVKDGLGIYNAIARRADDVTVRVTGYAVSIASVIPLAASRVISPKSSIWMIHEPWAMTIGDAEDMLKSAEMLDKHAKLIAEIYSENGAKSADEFRALMRDETWMNGEEAASFWPKLELAEANPMFNAIPADFLARCRNAPKHLLSMLAERQHQRQVVNSFSIGETAAEEKPKIEQARNGEAHMETQTQTQNAADITPKIDELKNELAAVKAELEVLKAPAPKAAVHYVGNSLVDKIRNARPGLERKKLIEAHGFNECRAAMESVLPTGKRWGDVYDANSFASTLIPHTIIDEAIIGFKSLLPPIGIFTRNFGVSALRPLATVQVPKLSSMPAVQVNPTTFTPGDITLAAVPVTVNHLSEIVGVTFGEFNTGFDPTQFGSGAALQMGQKMWSIIAALLTTDNFGVADTVAESNFGREHLQKVFAEIEFPIRHLLLSAGYSAKLLRWEATELGFQADGFSGVYTVTDWSAAGSNVRGFGCAPDAIVLAGGLPAAIPSQLNSGQLMQESITIPDVSLPIQFNAWFNLSTRGINLSLDVMFGAAVGDANVGTLLKIA